MFFPERNQKEKDRTVRFFPEPLQCVNSWVDPWNSNLFFPRAEGREWQKRLAVEAWLRLDQHGRWLAAMQLQRAPGSWALRLSKQQLGVWHVLAIDNKTCLIALVGDSIFATGY